ncbi:hypothetical protein GGH99_000286 [Coemansia sp. RSA 1285]|nr:hypothetical protein GGH99_000286 [Coemansia sp. RSA 1285]
MSLVVRLCVRPAACRASIAGAGIAKAGRAACVAAGRYRQCAGALRTTAMAVKHSSRSISTTTTTTTTGEAELEEGEGEQPIPGIDKELVRALRELHGVEVPTPLQRAIAREMVCDVEQHLFIRQETGTGKTLMMLAAVLSQAVRDFHRIKTMKINGAPITTNKVFTALAVNAVIVVPNRELALQLEAWSHALLRCAYPRLPAIRFVQRFVAQTVAEEEELGGIGGGSGSGSSNRRELRVLDRHGPPVVVIGTYRRLLQLFRDPSVPLVVRPPRLMRDLFSGSILPERSRPKTADGTEAEMEDEMEAEEEADAKRLASPFDSSVGDPNRFLQALHSRSKWYASRMAGRGALEREDLESFVGLRKLVVDEIDSTLSLDSRHSSSSNNNKNSYKTRRKGHSTPSAPPPRLGQVLVKAIMEMCGSTSMLAHVMGVGKEDGNDSRAPSIYQRTLATSLSPSEIRDLGASGTRTRLTTETVQRLSSIFASVSQGAMARLRAAEASRLAAPRSPDSDSNSNTAGRIRRENEILMSDRRLSTASPASLQVVVAAATPTRSLRHWLQVSGCLHGQVSYLERKQREAHEPHNIPPAIKHHCLIIENGQVVRNLRQKQRIARDSNDWMRKSQAAAAGRQGGRDRRPMENEDADEEEGYGATNPNESRRMLSGMIGEVAGNVIEHFAPTGPVLIFTHPSANKQALIQGLRPFGIVPRDILDHFRARDQQQKQQTEAEAEAAMEAAEPRTLYRRQRLPPPVYLISEPAARGLDLPDTSLVLVLDTPSSSASYLHMAGRTGRFGRTGHVVSVMPMGVFGFFESKMRAVYSVLGIAPERLTLVND